MAKTKRKEESKILKYFLIIIVILLVFEFLFNFSGKLSRVEVEEKQVFLHMENSTLVRMSLPAIDVEGRGVSTILSVEATPGSGRTLVDIENLLFWADTQHSIRIARLVADKFTGNIEEYDLIYNIEANASLVGGPSAGAAITIATIFALKGEKFREDVMITGSINHDGSIGPVSAILEKAKASKEAGASVFLVPLLQSRDVIYETRQYCEKFGFTEICTVETIPRKVKVYEEVGIQVEEVENIEQALKYFS